VLLGSSPETGRIRAVAVLSGARDHFQLPLALHEGALLEALVTDWYWPADRAWFDRTAGRLLSHSVIEKRYQSGLASNRVHVSKRALAAFALMKLGRSTTLNPYKGAVLSREARDLALKGGAALIAYSTYGMPAFEERAVRPRHRILFQMHPHPATARQILEDEMERVPLAKRSLSTEYEFAITRQEYHRLCQEPALANGWMVASSYTAATLAEHGIPLDRIRIVPYGVNRSVFPQRSQSPQSREPFRIVYVGSMIQRKGLSYLLDAVRLIGHRHVRVVLCGRGVIDHSLLDHYSDLPLEVHIGVRPDALVRLIQASDIFVLPSLTEGFAHVILEAMACGVPVLTTTNTCAPDVMCDGTHGFIVPIRTAEAIADRLTWAIDNRNDLAAMGAAAALQAGSFTWERFRAGVRDAYEQILAAD